MYMSFKTFGRRIVGLTKDERLRLMLVTSGILFALALVVVILRLYRLSERPPVLHYDEAAHGLDALRVFQGKHSVFFPSNNGREGLVVYMVALATSFLGRTTLAIRLPTALASAATVFAVFWLGRVLFGEDGESRRATPWRGLAVGGVGAGLTAVSLGQTAFGRMAFRGNYLPLFLCLCVALLWLGWRQRSWWQVALAGAVAGLLQYTYIPARFTPFLFLFFGLSFLLPLGSFTKAKVRNELPWVGIFVVVAGLVAAPMLVYSLRYPGIVFMRSSQLWDVGQGQAFPQTAFLSNMREYLLRFGLPGGEDLHLNDTGQFALNPFEAFFFWLGVGIAVWRWQRRSENRFLLIWVAVLILPVMFASGSSSIRMIGAVPAIYLLTAVGVWETVRFFTDRFFQKNRANIFAAMGVVISGLILIQGVLTYRNYFDKSTKFPGLFGEQASVWVDLAHALNIQPSDSTMVYLIPTANTEWLSSLRFLYQGAAQTYLIDVFAPDLAGEIESALMQMESISAVKLVKWNTTNYYIRGSIAHFAFLLDKYGQHSGSEEFADFQVHNYADVSLDSPWTFYEQLEPLTVLYDGGISLQGFALGQDEEQLSSRQPFNLGQDRSLWAFLQWQIHPGMDTDFAVSLRFYNDEGEMVYQHDDVPRRLTDHSPTSHWAADEVVDTLFYLDFPPDLQSGNYELRLVVYDFNTRIPTVEIDVWEPEVTVARLPLLFTPSAQIQNQNR